VVDCRVPGVKRNRDAKFPSPTPKRDHPGNEPWGSAKVFKRLTREGEKYHFMPGAKIEEG